MFEKIVRSTTAAVVEGVHRALTELFELRRQPREWEDIKDEIAHSSISNLEQAAATAVALSILREIKFSWSKDLSDLTDDELREVTEKLSQIVGERAAREPFYDEKQGNEVLNALRAEYSLRSLPEQGDA
jgi:hypothetical protein